jgi:hypothetical protein
VLAFTKKNPRDRNCHTSLSESSFPTSSSESALLGSSTASIALALGASIVSLVVHGTLGVGAEVLERVLGRVLGLLGAAGDALVVGVGGG